MRVFFFFFHISAVLCQRETNNCAEVMPSNQTVFLCVLIEVKSLLLLLLLLVLLCFSLLWLHIQKVQVFLLDMFTGSTHGRARMSCLRFFNRDTRHCQNRI